MTTQAMLSDLTPDQRAAATYLNGPLRIIAGAGTGKTKTIAARYAWLVQQDIDPAAILTLTFSAKAAHEMRSRILEHLGSIGGRLPIQTFHAFCLRLLTDWDRTSPPNVISDAQRYPFLREAAIRLDADNRLFYRGAWGTPTLTDHLGTFVDRAQDDLLTPDALFESASRRGQLSPRLADLTNAYRFYLDVLQKSGQTDFASLTTQVVERLQADPSLQCATRDRFAHILVDEFQDTNAAQFELVKLLVPAGDYICVVGDANQAIYGFRGGRSEYLIEFHRVFPAVETIRLQTNYRSVPAILTAANALARAIESEPLQLEPTRSPADGQVTVTRCPTSVSEANAICAEIIALATRFPNPVPLHHIAVLFRSVTNDGADLLTSLRDHDIPVTVTSGRSDFTSAKSAVLSALRLANGQIRWSDVSRLAAFRDFDGLHLASLERLLDPTQRNIMVQSGQLPEANTDPALLDAAGQLSSLPREVRSLREDTHAKTLYSILCWLELLSEETDPTDAAAWRAMFEQANAADQAKRAFPELIELLAIPSDSSDTAPEGPGVRIMTVHAAKGLEWPIVFIAGFSDGLFPSRLRKDRELDALDLIRAPEDPDPQVAETQAQASYLREERRLAYVAATRARDRLYITWRESDDDRELAPSPFIAEMGLTDAPSLHLEPTQPGSLPALRRNLRASNRNASRATTSDLSAADHLAVLLTGQWAGSGAIPGISPIRSGDLPLPHTSDSELHFSFSSLETYQDCARKYMYQSVLGLSKDETGTSLALGNSVHDALEILNKEWQRTRQVPGSIAIEAALNATWDDAGFEFRELSRQIRIRAGAMLHRYFAWEASNGRNRIPVDVEGSLSVKRGNHNLRGRIDLVLEEPDGSREIIDFKTGSPSNYKIRESLQLFLYAEALASSSSTGAFPKAAYVILRHEQDKGFRTGENFDSKKQYGPNGAIDLSADVETDLGATADHLLAGILANDFSTNPGDACRFCRCRWICPAGLDAE